MYLVVKQITWAGMYLFDGDGIESNLLYQNGTSPGLKAYAGTSSGENSDCTLNQYKIVRVLFNGASSKLQVAENAATTFNCSVKTAGGFTLASKANGLSNFVNAEYKEIILRNTTDDEAAILAYLKAKYTL